MKTVSAIQHETRVSTHTQVSGAIPTGALNYLVAVLCLGILVALHATHPLDSDEGLILHGAWSILNGRMLYTDFFEFVAPGSFYLVAAIWKLFGAHYWVAKSAAILAIAGAVLGVYRLSQLIITEQKVDAPQWTMYFGPVVFCLYSAYWPAINHNTFNIALVVWSTYFVVRSGLRRSSSDAALGGFICGLAVVFLQHRGAVLAAMAVPALYVLNRDETANRWKAVAAFLAGLLIPLGAMFLIWPASMLFDNLIDFPASRYLEVNRVDLAFFQVTATFIVLAVWLLRQNRSRAVWFLLALQLVFFAGALQRPDLSHITPILFPMLALSPVLLITAFGATRVQRMLVGWVVGGLMMVNMLVPIIFSQRQHAPFFEVSQHPLVQYVRENCKSSPFIYAGPFLPGVYFETGKLNATRYSVLLTRLSTDSHFAEALKDIAERRPQCLLTSYAMVEKFKYDKRNVVDEYIAKNYQVVKQLRGVQVWVAQNP